jgi:predicted Zn-dependent protease
MKQLPVLPDSDPVTQYVQKLGGRLAARAPGYQWPYNLHVVNVKEINAFAVPRRPEAASPRRRDYQAYFAW